jgi:hypothetical protein
MSYIRCHSNPEGMYIYGNADGMIEIYSGRGWHLSNIGPDQEEDRGMYVPGKTFYEMCKKANHPSIYDEESPYEIDGFRVEEVLIYLKTGKRVPNRGEKISKNFFSKRAAETIYAIKLSYKHKYVFMYLVTWEYIRRNALASERWSKSTKSKKSKRPKRARKKQAVLA